MAIFFWCIKYLSPFPEPALIDASLPRAVPPPQVRENCGPAISKMAIPIAY